MCPAPPWQSNVVVLESLRGAPAVLYLDFQGGYTPMWGGIAYQRPSVNNSQIRDIWKRVAEDYMPFGLNVTTDRRVFDQAPQGQRQRVIITPTSTASPGSGGIAYTGSFNWTGDPDTPCWVFMTNPKSCAEAVAHEAGHTLGLQHAGQYVDGAQLEYYSGHGSGETGWAPIMGVGYYQPVSQWSRGEYTHADPPRDDLAILAAANNGVAWRADDTGSTPATSRHLEIDPAGTAFAEGVIDRSGDIDAFQFATRGGLVSLRASPAGAWANLALSLSVWDFGGALIASNNPQTTLWAAVAADLPAGSYLVRVEGAGRNSPLTNGFSAYGSLGYYSVTGQISGARLSTRLAVGEHALPGTVVGQVAPLDMSAEPLACVITSGNTGGTFALDDRGLLTVQSNALLDYATLAAQTSRPVQFELFVTLSNLANPALTETNRRVVVLVTNVNDAPVLAGFTAEVFEHSLPGTSLGFVSATDPDFYTLPAYSLAAGNPAGLFAVNPETGELTVAGDLDRAARSRYELAVTVSDQTPPAPLLATSTVVVVVLPNPAPYRPGAIAWAVYDNVRGAGVAGLTNAPSFPGDPSFEKPRSECESDANRANDYGAVLRGFLIAPAAGAYTFWIAADDTGELWLSTSTNPASASLICRAAATAPRDWSHSSAQQSAPVSLAAGQACYLEARMKQTSGGDHLSVAWQSANIPRQVIPGRFLAPYPMNYPPHPAPVSATVHRDALPDARIGTVTVTDANTSDHHLFTLEGGSGAFSINPDTGILRVANPETLRTLPGTNLSLRATVVDSGAPPLSNSVSIPITLSAPGALSTPRIQQEMWTNIAGAALSDLTNISRFALGPDLLRPLTNFDTGINLGDAYGSRVRALVTPPASGAYTFFIASDETSQLSLGSSPASAVVIASVSARSSYQTWTQFPSQQSAPILLQGGQPYYLEALHKEASGVDYLSVAWTGPGLAGTNVIAGAYLSPPDINTPPVFSGTNIALAAWPAAGTQLAILTASDSPLDTLLYTILSGAPPGAFTLDPDTGVLRLASPDILCRAGTNPTLLTVVVQDSGCGGVYPLRTSEARVSILFPAPARPRITGFAPAGTGRFQLRIDPDDGAPWTARVSTNLQTWEPLPAPVESSNGWRWILDPGALESPRRFYRLGAW